MDLDEFINQIKLDKTKIKGLKKYFILNKFPELLILNNLSGSSFREMFYFFIYNEKNNKCYCGKETKFREFNFDYAKFCSKHCSNTNKELNDSKNKNRIQTHLDKYGVTHPHKLKEITDKVKKTKLERYGEGYNKEIFKKINEKYGVENISQLQSVKDKKSKNCLIKYGVDNNFKSEEIKIKIKETNIKKYGELPGFGSKKYKESMIKKYGESSPAHILEIFERRKNSAFKFKEYILPNKEKVYVQGFENIALDYYFKNKLYNVGDVIVDNKEIENNVGKIFYYYNNRKHRYYPDFYIKSINKIIEIKSSYTYTFNPNKNQEKANACRRLGFNFEINILEKIKDIINIEIKENFL